MVLLCQGFVIVIREGSTEEDIRVFEYKNIMLYTHTTATTKKANKVDVVISLLKRVTFTKK